MAIHKKMLLRICFSLKKWAKTFLRDFLLSALHKIAHGIVFSTLCLRLIENVRQVEFLETRFPTKISSTIQGGCWIVTVIK